MPVAALGLSLAAVLAAGCGGSSAPPATTPKQASTPSVPVCSALLAAGADVGTAVAANAGETVCLSAGTYSLGPMTPATRTVVKALDDAAVTVSGDLGASKNITIQGVTVHGSAVQKGASGVTYDRDTFTSDLCVYGAHTTVTNSTFKAITASCGEGRIQIGKDADGTVIDHNYIGDGGCTDGIQISDGGAHTRITFNEIANITQTGCTSHSDGVQFYGATDTLVDHNYFHGNSTGVMTPDGNGSPFTATHNVMNGTGYCCAVFIGGGDGDTVTGNTFGGGWNVHAGPSNEGVASKHETISPNTVTQASPVPKFATGPRAGHGPPPATAVSR